MFSHHLRYSSNPRESPRRKQIVFDKPPFFVQPSWWVSLHSRYTIIRSKTIFFSLLSLFLSSSQADMHCRCSLVYPKRVFRHLQSVWFCTLCFIKRIRSCLQVWYICMCARAGCAFDYHAICLASTTAHVFLHMCISLYACLHRGVCQNI